MGSRCSQARTLWVASPSDRSRSACPCQSPAKTASGSASSTGGPPLNLNIDLAQLDAQFDELIGIGASPHDNGDGSTAVKAEAVKEEVKSEATPTKRRRTGRLSRGGSSQSLSHGVADVEVGGRP